MTLVNPLLRISTLSSIQVPLLLPLNPKAISYLSTIKVGANIPFVKEWLNNYLEIEPNTDLIRMLYRLDTQNNQVKKAWNKGFTIAKAVKGSSFAVVWLPDDDESISTCIFFQDPQLHLRARYCGLLGTSDRDKWNLGEQVTELYLSMSKHRPDFRWLQPWCTATWDAHNCWSCLLWWCEYKCDVEKCTRTPSDSKLV